LGRTWYGYATTDTLMAPRPYAVRRLEEGDRWFVAALRKDVAPAVWTEAGMDDGPRYGCWLEGRLVAGAGLGMGRGMPTIGVLTHPAHCGRGRGRAVVVAAAREALDAATHVQYRALTASTASIALGARRVRPLL
jgi:GNAT superfamily N-acetyltransferase